jgi:AbrB family looped-hinge helix DNA binding protein
MPIYDMSIKTKPKKKGNMLYRWSTVSSKGQIAIPIEVRRKLAIEDGDRLLIIIRKNEDGINLIKENAVDSVFRKLSK